MANRIKDVEQKALAQIRMALWIGFQIGLATGTFVASLVYVIRWTLFG